MTSKQLWITIAAVAILAAICGIAIKSCHDKKTVIITPTQIKKDSVEEFYKDAEVIIDSLIAVTKGQNKAKDSLKAIKERQEVELYQKGARIAYLVRQAQLQAQYRDTAAELRTVDTLLPHVQEITEAAQNYLNQNRLLQNSYDSLLSTNSLQISKLDYEKDVLKDNFDQISATAIELEKQNQKLSKKKRWGLGAEVGYIFDGYKAKPGVSVGLHYSLIRF